VLTFTTNFPAAAVPDEPPPSTEKKEEPKSIEFDRSAIPKDDVWLKNALDSAPEMKRGLEIDAPGKVVFYMLARPYLAYRIADDYGYSPILLEKSEEGDDWEVTGGTGAVYSFRKLWEKDGVYFLRFTFFYRAPVGIGLKTSGAGAVVVRFKESGKAKNVIADYDVYFSPGDLPLDKLTEYFPLQKSWIMEDFSSISDAFTDLCESISDDPESILDDMEWSEDDFTAGELKNFRETFTRE